MAQFLVEKGKTFEHFRVSFSLDAATQEVYYKIRGKDLDQTLKNIRYLQDCKKRLRVSNPLVLINMTLSKTNIGDLPKFIKLAHNLDAQVELNNLAMDKSYESIQVNRRNQFSFDYKTEILTGYPKLYNQYLRKAEQLGTRLKVTIHKASDVTYMDIPQPGFRFVSLFREFLKKHFTLHQINIFGKESSQSSREKDPSFEKLPLCLLPWSQMVISSKGDISLCCVQGLIGHLRDYTSIEEAWNSEKICRIREQLSKKIFPPECQTADCTVRRWNTRVCIIHQ
jgi:MoaA/NifB/PqqE/SkfB family radical SAM enzyme